MACGFGVVLENTCYKELGVKLGLAATAMVLQSPLEKALNNHVECLNKEEEDEVQACIEELDGAKAVVSLSLDRALSETQPLSETSAA